MSADKRSEAKSEDKDAPRVTGKLFVMCEMSEHGEAEALINALPKDDAMHGAKLIVELPLARLDEGDGLCALRRKGSRYVDDPKLGRKPLPGDLAFTPVVLAADHWDSDKKTGSGRVRSAGMLDVFGRSIVPATVKRNDTKRDEDAIRISYV